MVLEGRGEPSPFTPFLTSNDERIVFDFFWNNPEKVVPFMKALVLMSHEALGEEPLEYFKDQHLVYNMAQRTGASFFKEMCGYKRSFYKETHHPIHFSVISAVFQYFGSRPLKLECQARLTNHFSKERDFNTFEENASAWLNGDCERLRNIYFLLNQKLEETNYDC